MASGKKQRSPGSWFKQDMLLRMMIRSLSGFGFGGVRLWRIQISYVSTILVTNTSGRDFSS